MSTATLAPTPAKTAPRKRAPAKPRPKPATRKITTAEPEILYNTAPQDKTATNGKMAAYIKAQNVKPAKRHRGPQDLTIGESPLADGFDSLSEFVAAPPSVRVLATAWAASNHVFDLFPAHAHLAALAEGAGCGKTTFMEVAGSLSHKAESFSYATAASIYNFLDTPEGEGACILLDEADRIAGESGRARSRNGVLIAMINAGYASQGTVRVTRAGKSVKIKVYTGGYALAGLGNYLPEDTATRCLPVCLEKGMPNSVWLPEVYGAHQAMLAAQLRDWLTTEDATMYLKSQPKMLDDIDGDPRFKLIMASMGAVCSLAGIYDLFRESVHEVMSDIKANPPMTTGALLLCDLKEAWPDATTVLTAMDVAALVMTHDSGRWKSWAKLTPAQTEKLVAWLLANAGKPGIRTQTVKVKGKDVRGYARRAVFSTIPDNGRSPIAGEGNVTPVI
jgi:hypothetical protein